PPAPPAPLYHRHHAPRGTRPPLSPLRPAPPPPPPPPRPPPPPHPRPQPHPPRRVRAWLLPRPLHLQQARLPPLHQALPPKFSRTRSSAFSRRSAIRSLAKPVRARNLVSRKRPRRSNSRMPRPAPPHRALLPPP